MQFNESPDIGGGGMFLRLKDGESVKGIPRGSNKVFYVRWNGTHSEPCEKGDEGAKFRFKFNLVINENGEYKAKVFENGAALYNAMKELSEDYDLTQTVVKIKREGNGLDTKYYVTPMPQKIDATQLKQIKSVELNSLEAQGSAPVPNMAPTFDSDEEIPF